MWDMDKCICIILGHWPDKICINLGFHWYHSASWENGVGYGRYGAERHPRESRGTFHIWSLKKAAETACHGNPGNHGNVARGEMVLEWFYPLVNQHNYGKSPFSMGKSTISMAIFQFANCKRLPCWPDRVHGILPCDWPTNMAILRRKAEG